MKMRDSDAMGQANRVPAAPPGAACLRQSVQQGQQCSPWAACLCVQVPSTPRQRSQAGAHLRGARHARRLQTQPRPHTRLPRYRDNFALGEPGEMCASAQAYSAAAAAPPPRAGLQECVRQCVPAQGPLDKSVCKQGNRRAAASGAFSFCERGALCTKATTLLRSARLARYRGQVWLETWLSNLASNVHIRAFSDVCRHKQAIASKQLRSSIGAEPNRAHETVVGAAAARRRRVRRHGR